MPSIVTNSFPFSDMHEGYLVLGGKLLREVKFGPARINKANREEKFTLDIFLFCRFCNSLKDRHTCILPPAN